MTDDAIKRRNEHNKRFQGVGYKIRNFLRNHYKKIALGTVALGLTIGLSEACHPKKYVDKQGNDTYFGCVQIVNDYDAVAKQKTQKQTGLEQLTSSSTSNSINTSTSTRKKQIPQTAKYHPSSRTKNLKLGKQYIISRGDTFSKIAGDFNNKYGTDISYKYLANLNNKKNPNKIKVGEKIKMPTLEQLALREYNRTKRTQRKDKKKIKKHISKKPKKIATPISNATSTSTSIATSISTSTGTFTGTSVYTSISSPTSQEYIELPTIKDIVPPKNINTSTGTSVYTSTSNATSTSTSDSNSNQTKNKSLVDYLKHALKPLPPEKSTSTTSNIPGLTSTSTGTSTGTSFYTSISNATSTPPQRISETSRPNSATSKAILNYQKQSLNQNSEEIIKETSKIDSTNNSTVLIPLPNNSSSTNQSKEQIILEQTPKKQTKSTQIKITPKRQVLKKRKSLVEMMNWILGVGPAIKRK